MLDTILSIEFLLQYGSIKFYHITDDQSKENCHLLEGMTISGYRNGKMNSAFVVLKVTS